MKSKLAYKRKATPSFSSIVQLVILVLGLVVAVFLTDQAQKYIGRASTSPTPKAVKITNLTDNSFSVSWLTDKPSTGAIILMETGEKIFFDDRSSSYTSNSLFETHQATVKNLLANKTYNFVIQSGKDKFKNQGVDYQVTTLTTLSTVPPPAISLYGTVLNSQQIPQIGVLVYLESDLFQPLSTITSSGGNFVLTFNNSRTYDNQNYYLPKVNDLVKLVLDGGSLGNLVKEVTLTGSDLGLTNLVLTPR